MSCPKVSVIIPIYNAYHTVAVQIDSFLTQTFVDFEIILVDDGSTDSTLNLLENYAIKDNRIRVFHKSNGGVATARQHGLDRAQGEFIIHADADDWVEPTMLEEMVKKADQEGLDMLISDDFINTENGKQLYRSQGIKDLSSTAVLKGILLGKYFGGLCHKLIRKELYLRYNASFFEGINYCEDVLICAQILKHESVKVGYLPKAFYHYQMNKSSITHNINRKTYEGLLRYRKKIGEILDSSSFEEYLERIDFTIFHEGFTSKGVMTSGEIRESYNRIKDYAISHSPKRWRVGFVFIEFGMYWIARKLLHY